ncbi:GSCOCG00006940001-RA-CDS [Cotesia congregata]|uniref:Similar to RpA-70: Replication protein A 70 kDa DNA-binding subunit (Drosophila melanogaster) n=1 Tax=Cotesia congregata TaxID=51543 RepID=A0A8J2HC52_COTCN|nr:GSCOCG00006940001-RA-CDS [Cotesia congregata]CAG5092929.1 Similar to RpA-70: Replication protein A 70 kDa DNA-binding subunit (Drosophila melanogaster) [Cotesia congregata]
MDPILSWRAIEQITEQGLKIEKPNLQFLGFKKVMCADKERYRVFLNDGITSNSFAMLAPELNHLITNNILTMYSIVQITRYGLSEAKKGDEIINVMVILDLKIQRPGREVPGEINFASE